MIGVMTETKTLLQEIEDYLRAGGMRASTFGHKTANDGKLVDRLRSGKTVTLDTAERIRRYILDNPAKKKGPRRQNPSEALAAA